MLVTGSRRIIKNIEKIFKAKIPLQYYDNTAKKLSKIKKQKESQKSC